MPSVKTAPKATKATGKSSTKPARTLAGTSAASNGVRESILVDYQKAVTLMQQGDYSAAHPALKKLLEEAPPQFTDRIRMYLAACVAHANKPDAEFSSPEEQYDYAISLLNDGRYEDARDELNEIIASKNDADYAFYGLAVVASMTGDSQTCLDKLTEAIRLNTKNRIQARSDSDLQEMADDPRFTELLYPDA